MSGNQGHPATTVVGSAATPAAAADRRTNTMKKNEALALAKQHIAEAGDDVAKKSAAEAELRRAEGLPD